MGGTQLRAVTTCSLCISDEVTCARRRRQFLPAFRWWWSWRPPLCRWILHHTNLLKISAGEILMTLDSFLCSWNRSCVTGLRASLFSLDLLVAALVEVNVRSCLWLQHFQPLKRKLAVSGLCLSQVWSEVTRFQPKLSPLMISESWVVIVCSRGVCSAAAKLIIHSCPITSLSLYDKNSKHLHCFCQKVTKKQRSGVFPNNRATQMFKTGEEQVIQTLKSRIVVKPKE